MGYLADRFSRKAMAVVGSLLAAMALSSYIGAERFDHLLLSGIVFGLGGGIAMPAVMAMAVQKGNAIDSMGSVMGLLTVAHSLGMLAGAVVAGAMMDWFDLRGAFVLGAVLMVSGVVAFSVSVRGETVDAPRPARIPPPLID